MTTEYEALLRAVRAAPDDDLPRLVLADGSKEKAQSVIAAAKLAGRDWQPDDSWKWW